MQQRGKPRCSRAGMSSGARWGDSISCVCMRTRSGRHGSVAYDERTGSTSRSSELAPDFYPGPSNSVIHLSSSRFSSLRRIVKAFAVVDVLPQSLMFVSVAMLYRAIAACPSESGLSQHTQRTSSNTFTPRYFFVGGSPGAAVVCSPLQLSQELLS